MRLVTSMVSFIGGIALALVFWFKHPDVIVWLLDFNLKMIKLVISAIPAPYGAMIESALRVGFVAEKSLILTEAMGVVGGLIWFLGELLVKKK